MMWWVSSNSIKPYGKEFEFKKFKSKLECVSFPFCLLSYVSVVGCGS